MMAVGGVLMLFVAGILEGGFRQLVQSTPLRFAIGLGDRRAVAALLLPLRPPGTKMMTAQDAPRMPPPLPSALQERTSRVFRGDLRRQRRQIVTPEGVPVTVRDRRLRRTPRRLQHRFCDLDPADPRSSTCRYFSLISRTGGSLIAISIALFIGFLVRNLYFIYFELAWQGATPGKRMSVCA